MWVEGLDWWLTAAGAQGVDSSDACSATAQVRELLTSRHASVGCCAAIDTPSLPPLSPHSLLTSLPPPSLSLLLVVTLYHLLLFLARSSRGTLHVPVLLLSKKILPVCGPFCCMVA